jgi:hydroxymethylbilane synthase
MTAPLRIATRGSKLALAQTEMVIELLGVPAEPVVVVTSGDQKLRVGDKSRWVDTLESAVLNGDVDMALHCAKDVPTELAQGCELVSATARGSAFDALIGTDHLDSLPSGARVGTSSLRRRSQLLATRQDLVVEEIRGNVDSRLQRLADGSFDALVMAAAGIQRLDRGDEIGYILEDELFVPAPGQGILVLEIRSDNDRVAEIARSVTDNLTWSCLLAERALVRSLKATCHTPAGAYAVPNGSGELRLKGYVGLPDGTEWLLDELVGSAEDPEELGTLVAQRMIAAGASSILERAATQALEIPGQAGKPTPNLS